MDLHFGEKQELIKHNTCVLFSISTWLLLASFLQIRNNHWEVIIDVGLVPVVIAAILNTITDIIYYKQSVQFYYSPNDDDSNLKMHLLFRGIALGIFYTAIYNTVLLPLGGFGVIEYCLVAYVLFLNLINYIMPRKVIFNPSSETKKQNKIATFVSFKKSLYILHGMLFFIKFITWVLPENLYQKLVTGNDTVRTFIAVGVFIMLCLFLIAGIVAIKNKLKISDKTIDNVTSKTKSVGKKIASGIGKVLKKGGQLIVSAAKAIKMPSLVSGIIALVLIVLAGICFIVLINTARSDMLDFVEPLFIKMFSTGKYAIQLSPVYYILQCCVAIGYVVFLLLKDNKPSTNDIDYALNHLNLEDKTKDEFVEFYKQHNDLQDEILHNTEFYKCFIEENLVTSDISADISVDKS